MKAPQPSFARSEMFVVLGTLMLALLCGCATRATKPTTNHSFSFDIGNMVVQAEVLQCGSSRPTMINVHDDENTSVKAGKAVIRRSGGRLIELSHGGRRRVSFELEGARYSFDPNRIFSEEGIRHTLGRDGNDSVAAQRAVEQFASEFLKRFALDREPAIIALHNNSPDDLSIDSYRPGHELANTSATVHVATHRSPDDFFYVTDRRFFDYLKQSNFNVTLQDNANVPDDGSLSVYFGRKGIPYVNIEAAHGHLHEQIEMVRCAQAMLQEIIFTSR